MSDDQQLESYTWEIAGKRAINPDIFLQNAAENGYDLHHDDPLIMIDCPRGGHPGTARLLFSQGDAEYLSQLSGPQIITVKRWTQNASNDQHWSETESFQFHGYHIHATATALDVSTHSTLLTLADERHAMAQASVRRRYNVVIKKGKDISGDYDPTEDEYDPATLIVTDTPFTYQQILNDLLNELVSPPVLTLPVTTTPPRNLVFDCSLADALDQLLASLGCCLAYNPFASTNRFHIVQLDNAANYSVLQQARSAGRLIEREDITACPDQTPVQVSIRPNDIVELDDEAQQLPPKINASVLGSGVRTILIDDHEFIPDASRIESSVNAWHAQSDHPLNETYFGILQQSPAEQIAHVRWYMADGTKTQVQNYVDGEIPWPKQPVLCATKKETSKTAFIVQGLLGTRPGSGPESKFPAWGGDILTAYIDIASVVNISPAPYTNFVPFAACRNPHGLNGEEGDTFVAVRNPNAVDEFILTAVYSKKATIFFTFSANRANGLYDVTCTGTVVSWRHSGKASPLVLKDTMGVAINARSGDYGYAQWNTDKQCWSIIAAKHYATRILGALQSEGEEGQWTATPTRGLDGYINAEDEHDVVNPDSWLHPGSGGKVWYELDPLTGDWVAYQVSAECPPPPVPEE